MAVILDGKSTALKIRQQIAVFTNECKNNGYRQPCLAVILVGNDNASQIYVRNKVKACEEAGILSKKITFDENISENELLKTIYELNHDKLVDGILVQMPLPKTINPDSVIDAIMPEKDVDAFHSTNVSNMYFGKDGFLPCTPGGIITLLDEYGIEISGKNTVIIGRSNIVGKPMALMMLQRNATVTVCHSKTADLKSYTEKADILVSAVGKANLVKGDMVKNGVVIVDVGMNRDSEGKLCGDVCFDECEKKASFITPVPGGVGPMTIATLLQNTIKSYTERVKK